MATEKVKKIWDNCMLIDEVLKSPSTKLRIELVSRDGVKYVNIREWYKKKSDNVWKPGLAGFAMPVMFPIDGEVDTPAANLLDTIQEALDKASDFELANDDNAVWSVPKVK
jgi:hypothetical protein